MRPSALGSKVLPWCFTGYESNNINLITCETYNRETSYLLMSSNIRRIFGAYEQKTVQVCAMRGVSRHVHILPATTMHGPTTLTWCDVDVLLRLPGHGRPV